MSVATQEGALELRASLALAAQEGDDGKGRITALAYSGGVITVPGLGRVVVDLSGMELPSQVKLCADHTSALEGIVGHASGQVRDNKLYVEGALTDATEAGQRVLALARDGVEFEASIGARVRSRRYVRKGDTVNVNGRTIKAEEPFHLVEKSKLHEVSIVAFGADENTSVTIAANGGSEMGEERTVVEEIREQEAAETERINAIRELCEDHQGIEAKAIKEGWDVTRTEVEVLRASRPKASPIYPSRRDAGPDVLAAAVLMHAGMPTLVESEYGEHTAQRAEDARLGSLMEFCKAALQMEGVEEPAGRNEMIRAAFSTASLPVALGDAANKVLLNAYREAPASWAGFAKTVDANDFKDTNAIRPSWTGSVEQVPEDGELHHGSLSEAVTTFNVDTFGKILRVTRKMVINDDMGFLNDTAAAYGRMARRGLNDLVWSTIMANAGDFFHADNGNLLTGAGSALDAGSLGSAVSYMRAQRDAENNDLDITPAVLATPPELEVTARALLESAELQAAEGDPTGNALKGVAKLAVESRLSNTAKFSNASLTAWYLFAGPQDASVIVAFLRGQRTPTVEFFGLDHDVNTLGVSWRVYFDYGAALNDPRAAVKSDGA